MTFEQDFLQVKGITGTEEVFGTVDPVTEEKKDMVPIDMLGDDIGDIQHELEIVEDARASLEAYDKFLTQAGPDGISRQTAAAMYIGLARIDRQLGQRSELVASMEDNDLAEVDNRNKMAVAKGVDNKGIAGRGKQLFDKLKEIIAKLMEKLKKAWAFFTGKVNEAKEKAAKLTEAVKTWAGPNGPSGGRKVEVPGNVAMFVFKDGKVLSPSELMPIAKFAFEEYPSFLAKQFEEAKAALAKGEDVAKFETFLAFEGTLPDGWRVEDNGSGFPFAAFGGESGAGQKHQVRDKATITKAMQEVIACCDYIKSKMGDNGILMKLGRDIAELMQSTGNNPDEFEGWNKLLEISNKLATANKAATSLEHLASFAIHAQTKLGFIELEGDLK